MLQEILNIKGCQFAHIVYVSDVKLNGGKKNPLQGRVTKLVKNDVQLNYDYENAVNNRLEKQGLPRTFTAQTLPWGQWYAYNKVIEHKNEYYLRYYEKKNATPQVTYYIDGRAATAQEIANIKATLPKSNTISNTQTACGLDDEKEQVYPKNVKFANIIMLRVDGKTIVNDKARLAV